MIPHDIVQGSCKFILEGCLQETINILKEKNKIGEITLLDFKTYHKTILIKSRIDSKAFVCTKKQTCRSIGENVESRNIPIQI